MKISVFGQRNIKDDLKIKEEIDNVLSRIPESDYVTFLWGGAEGCQKVVYEYLNKNYDFVLFKPWTTVSKKLYNIATKEGKFDNSYFFFRNVQIVDNSDLVVIFDNGTKDSEVYKVKNLVEKKGKDHIVIEVKE